MSTVAVASHQQWKTVVFGQIKERNLSQTNGFKDIVKQYNAALRKEKEYKDRIVALEKEMMSLRQENSSGFKKPAGDNQRTSVSSPSPELEAKLQKLQEELTVSYKRNADNAQHMIDLSRRMKETQEENEKRVAETAHYKQKMEEAQAEEIRIREKMEDEGKTFRILQEEHLALRQSHDTILEENRRMLAENQQLVDRWLRKMAEEAEKMNTANAFYEQMVNDKTRHDVNNKVNPNNNAPLPLANAAPVPVVMKTAFFDAASFVDCNAILPAKPKRKISGHSDALTCVAYSRSGLVMATGSTDKTIRLWDAPSGMSKNVLHGPSQSVMCLDFSPSDEALLGASNDNACRIWGVDNCRLRHTLTGHVGKVFSAVFADTQKVITGSHDRTIKLWDLTKGYCTRTIFCFSSLNDLCIAPDGTLLVSGHIDHHLRFWDTKNGEVVHVMDGIHDSQITSVSLSPDGTKVLTNSRDNTLKIVDIRTHEVLVTLKDENYRNGLNWTRAAISPDSRYAAAGSMDGTMIVWNAMTGKVEKTIAKAHDSAIAACAWNPMGHQFASAGDKDKTIVIWE